MQHASGAKQSHHMPTAEHSLKQEVKHSFGLFMIISLFKQAVVTQSEISTSRQLVASTLNSLQYWQSRLSSHICTIPYSK